MIDSSSSSLFHQRFGHAAIFVSTKRRNGEWIITSSHHVFFSFCLKARALPSRSNDTQKNSRATNSSGERKLNSSFIWHASEFTSYSRPIWRNQHLPWRANESGVCLQITVGISRHTFITSVFSEFPSHTQRVMLLSLPAILPPPLWTCGTPPSLPSIPHS